MRQHVRRRIAPGHQLAVVPDKTVAVGHRHRKTSYIPGKMHFIRFPPAPRPTHCRILRPTARLPRPAATIGDRPRRVLRARLEGGPDAAAGDIRDTPQPQPARASRHQAQACAHMPSRAMLPIFLVSSRSAWACARTRNWTANSISTMPPAVVLEIEELAAIRMRGMHALAHGHHVGPQLRSSREAGAGWFRARASKAAPMPASPATKRARVNAWCSQVHACPRW